MKVKLRLQNGIVTGAVNVPENCVRTMYKLPIHREMKGKK